MARAGIAIVLLSILPIFMMMHDRSLSHEEALAFIEQSPAACRDDLRKNFFRPRRGVLLLSQAQSARSIWCDEEVRQATEVR